MNRKEPAATREFWDRVAVVTGAARGIGRAIARDLQARGARLVLVDMNGRGLAQTAVELSRAGRPPAFEIEADLGVASSSAKVGEQIAAAIGRVDILVNNAGIEQDVAFGQITPELFDRVMAVNLRAPLLLTQALARLFPPEGGAVVNISSIHAGRAFPSALPYACSKAALVALTRNLALELAPRKIRVNAVCPGYIDSPMWDEWIALDPNPEELAARTAALHPLGRRGLPQDVASAVAYLASPGAEWVTGTALVVDGGLTVRAHP